MIKPVHFIVLCKVCGKVITQCRCADLNKEKRYAVCDECKAKQEAKTPKEAQG